MLFKKNKFSSKTNVLLKTLMCLGIFISFLTCWILIGDIDILDKDWIVPHNGVYWSGYVNNTNLAWLENKYPSMDWNSHLNSYVSLKNDNGLVFNLNLIYIFFGLFLLFVATIIILKILKVANYDLFTLSISTMIFCLAFVFSAIIPVFNDSLIILVRIVISFILMLLCYFLLNLIFNTILMNSQDANTFFNDLEKENTMLKPYDEKMKKSIK